MYAWTLICKELAKIKEESANPDSNTQDSETNSQNNEGEDKRMKAPTSCQNLPLDEKILNRALMLLSLVMSEALIR